MTFCCVGCCALDEKVAETADMETLKSRAELILEFERQGRVPCEEPEKPYLHILLPKHDLGDESVKVQLALDRQASEAKWQQEMRERVKGQDAKLETLEAKMDAIQESMQAVLVGLHANGGYR